MNKRIDTKRKKKKSYKLLILILILVLAAVAAGGVFYGTYSYMLSKSLSSYDKTIKTCITDINLYNKKISTFVKGQTIDPDIMKQELSKNVDRLAEVRDDLRALNPSNMHRQSQTYLEEGLQNNILMYRQMLTIIQNPSSKDISNSISDFKNYNDEMLNNYSLYQNKSFDILVPKETKDFINKFTAYANELVKVNNETDSKVSQLMDFTEKLGGIINNFIPIKTDFGPSLQKVRAGSGTFDDVLIEIDDAKTKYQDLKKNFSDMPIPKDAQSIRNSFSKILDDYSLFLQELRFAVSNEKAKAASNPLSAEEQSAIYASANAKFEALSKKYDEFLKAYSEFKGNNIK